MSHQIKQPIRFGRRLTIERTGERVSATEQVIAQHLVIKSATQIVETVPCNDEKEVLAHFLKLLDRQKSGEVDMVGIQCFRNQETRALRAELSWFEPALALKQNRDV